MAKLQQVLKADSTATDCDEFTLRGHSCWITVENLSVWLRRMDGDTGLVIEVYPLRREAEAACAASGKQTCSGPTAWVRIERLTLWPFSYWKVRYSVGVGCQGGKIRLGGGELFLDVLVKLELVIFDGQ